MHVVRLPAGGTGTGEVQACGESSFSGPGGCCAAAALMGAPTAARGAKGKHPHLKLAEGTGRKPGQDAAGRPIEEPPAFSRKLPEKPDGLSPDAEWMWDQIIAHIKDYGVLKPMDGMALEVVCETFARWREAKRIRQHGVQIVLVDSEDDAADGKKLITSKKPGVLSTNSQGLVAAPWIGVEERAGRDFRAWCSEFGLTPAAERNLINADTSSDVDAGNVFK